MTVEEYLLKRIEELEKEIESQQKHIEILVKMLTSSNREHFEKIGREMGEFLMSLLGGLNNG